MDGMNNEEFGDLFKIFLQNKMDEEQNKSNNVNDAARGLHDLYEAFMLAGFSEGQAFELVRITASGAFMMR